MLASSLIACFKCAVGAPLPFCVPRPWSSHARRVLQACVQSSVSLRHRPYMLNDCGWSEFTLPCAYFLALTWRRKGRKCQNCIPSDNRATLLSTHSTVCLLFVGCFSCSPSACLLEVLRLMLLHPSACLASGPRMLDECCGHAFNLP